MITSALLALLLAASPAPIASSTEREIANLTNAAPAPVETPSRAEYLSCISKMQSVASDYLMATAAEKTTARMISRRIEVLDCVKSLNEKTPPSPQKTKFTEVFELYVIHMDSPSTVSVVEVLTTMGEFMAMLRNGSDR